MNVAEHKIANSLKTFYFCSLAFISVCVFNVWPKISLLPMWPRDVKRLDTPATTSSPFLGQTPPNSTTWPPLAGGPFVPQTQLAPNSSSCQISFPLLLTPSNGPMICLKSQARSLGVTSTPPSPSPPPHSPVSYLILLILFPKYFSNPNVCLHLLYHPIPSFSSGLYTSNFDLASATLPLQSRQ